MSGKYIIWDSRKQIMREKQNKHYRVNILFSLLKVSLHISILFLGLDIYRYQHRIKRDVGTVVHILFPFGYLLCDDPKLYLFVNNTQQDAYHKILVCMLECTALHKHVNAKNLLGKVNTSASELGICKY
jgi:hypothetical protein